MRQDVVAVVNGVEHVAFTVCNFILSTIQLIVIQNLFHKRSLTFDSAPRLAALRLSKTAPFLDALLTSTR
jgi:hypothetical protein